MRIAGLRGQFTSASLDDIPALWRRLTSLRDVSSRVDPVDYAVVLLLPDGCDYLAGFEISASTALQGGFVSTEIPANEYAVFAHDGHVSALRNTLDSAVNDWLPASDFEMGRTGNGEPYVLERYGEKFDPMAGTGDIEIWIPVRGRSSR